VTPSDAFVLEAKAARKSDEAPARTEVRFIESLRVLES
jgi:hypothetical protein